MALRQIELNRSRCRRRYGVRPRHGRHGSIENRWFFNDLYICLSNDQIPPFRWVFKKDELQEYLRLFFEKTPKSPALSPRTTRSSPSSGKASATPTICRRGRVSLRRASG